MNSRSTRTGRAGWGPLPSWSTPRRQDPPRLDNSFGGACAVSAQGTILGSLPLGRAGILHVDLTERQRQDPTD